MNSAKTGRLVYIFIVVLLNIGCDQTSKEIVRRNFELTDRIQIIENTVILSPVQNNGIMFGLGKDLRPLNKFIFFILVPFIAIALAIWWVAKRYPFLSVWPLVAVGCIIGGGLGNIIDRIVFGSVTDFLIVKTGFLRTGVFNLADLSITLGMLILIYLNSRPNRVT